jgi:hypothetical protein
VFFEYLPKQSISPRGAKTVWVRHGGKDKERVTVMLLGDSDGNKVAPFVVIKAARSKALGGDQANWQERRGFGVHIWKEAKVIMAATGMELFANPTAWWNANIHLEFLKVSFGSRPRPWQPVLLLVDDFSGHWAEGIDDYARSIDVHLLKVPPSCTATCQPADIAWNRPFKNHLRLMWVASLQAQLRDHDGSADAFKLKPPSRSELCSWVKTSWETLSDATIQNGFRKAHIISPLPSSIELPLDPLMPTPLPADVFSAIRNVALACDDGDLSSDDDFDADDECDNALGLE